MLIDEANTSPLETEDKPVESTEAVASTEIFQETQPEQETVMIPEKFRGKGLEDVIKSYSEAEREKSRLANELGETRKQLEVREAAWQSAQIQQQQPIHSQPIKTIEQQYLDEWERDPREAVINLQANLAAQQHMAQSQAETVNFYAQAKTGQLKGYEDFAELEPVMINLAQNIAKSYPGLVNPAYATHPATVQMLHLAARGLTLEARLQKAQSNGTKRAVKKMEEKERAFVESSSNSGGSDIPFEALSLDEMRKLLPKALIEG